MPNQMYYKFLLQPTDLLLYPSYPCLGSRMLLDQRVHR